MGGPVTERANSSPMRDVEQIECVRAYDGFFAVDRYRLRHALFAGGMGQEIVREVFERGHAAAVLPYDPVRDEVVLIEQFRIGAHAGGRPPWLIEIVAGIIEDGETPADVARREAKEEAGCEIGRLEVVGNIIVSPGGSSEVVSIYCGETAAKGIGGVHGLAHEGEDIRVQVVPAAVAFDMVRTGKIYGAPPVIALQWLALNHADLRQRWRL